MSGEGMTGAFISNHVFLPLESEAAPCSYPVALSNTSTEKMVPLAEHGGPTRILFVVLLPGRGVR